MLSLQITDLKKLTDLLFVSNSFDRFLLHDAQFTTAVSAVIDGRKNADFYSEEERDEALKESFVTWAEERAVCLDLLKGKKLPLSFKIVLLTAKDVTSRMKEDSGFTGCEVSSLSLNLIYRDSLLFLTTGVAYEGFSADKSLEAYWDKTVKRFLDGKDCGYIEN